MSVYESLDLMMSFGTLIVAIITLVIVLIVAMKNKKDKKK